MNALVSDYKPGLKNKQPVTEKFGNIQSHKTKLETTGQEVLTTVSTSLTYFFFFTLLLFTKIY